MLYKGNQRLLGVSVYLTSKCDRYCKECVQSDWMKSIPDYMLDLHEMMMFSDVSRKSSYLFDFIAFTGGEPMLNPNWHEIALICSYMTKDFILYTNGKKLLEWGPKSYEVGKLFVFDRVKISGYPETYDRLKEFVSLLPKELHVELMDHRRFQIKPEKAQDMEVDCGVNSIGLVGDKVYCCGNVTNHVSKFPEFQMDGIVTPVEVDFLDKLKLPGEKQPWCSVCMANRKTGPTIKTTFNEGKIKEWI